MVPVSPDDTSTPGPGGILGQVHIAVIRLDSKVDSMKEDLTNIRVTHKDGHVDHEGRLRVLENVRLPSLENRSYVSPATVWKAIGAVIGFSSLVVAIIGLSTR